MSILYKYNNDGVNFDTVRSLLVKAFSGRRIDSKEDVEKAFINSSHVVFAYDDVKIIGFARAISDLEWAIIYNVVVDPDYQSLGIGKEIMNRLIFNLGSRHIFAYTHPRTISFYEHLGFKRSKMAFKYVREEERDSISKMENVGFFLPNGYLFENEKEIKKDNKNEKNVNIRFINSLDDVNFDELNELLEISFNHKRDKEKTILEFKESNFVIFGYDANKLVSCARLVTDNVKEAILLNVAVLKGYQGLGIARKMINTLAKKASGYDIFIHANPKSYGFYNSHIEFKRYKTAFAYISKTEPDNADFFLPKGYRYQDELNNEEIKYYKGKILN